MADALEQLPAERRRQPRSWKPSGTAGLQSTAPGSRPLLDLASNDYLGLASHPDLLEAAGLAMQREGVGSGASRLVSGGRGVHDQLEARLAEWLQRERVLLFPSGFQANLAAV
ncbi:MAG: aminotransferase class I/II-fold pyridoxal phosphate-dependent enzyme, partial [Vulcanococcus sp.]